MSDSDDEDPGRQAARTVTTERWGIKGKSTAISTCACRFQNRLPGGRGGAGGAWWWLYVRETELEMAGGHCWGVLQTPAEGAPLSPGVAQGSRRNLP